MSHRAWPGAAATLVLAACAYAEDPTPFKLSADPPDQSVYALPTPASPHEGVNAGGVNLDIKLNYFTDYVYRGVNRGEALNPGKTPSNANFQFDGNVSFNLGKYPHPFIGVFANVLTSDPISNFQEVRPFLGAKWKTRPFTIAGGVNLYTFPDRSDQDTSEGWVQITLDDAVIFRAEEPFLSPYVYAAYDYDRYDGWYIEAGVKHDFVIEKTGLTITPVADVAYVASHGYFAGAEGDDTGFHHYDVGVVASYSLNLLLNIPQRYGQWSLNGYLYYTDGIDDELRSDSTVWGGIGIEFAY